MLAMPAPDEDSPGRGPSTARAEEPRVAHPPALSGNGRRLEWYIKISLYLLVPGFLIGGILSMLATLGASPRAGAPGDTVILIILTILGLLGAAADLVVAHLAIGQLRRPRRRRRVSETIRWVSWFVVNVMATVGWTWFLFSRGAGLVPLWLFGATAVVAVIPLLSWRSTLVATICLVAANTVAIMLSPMDPALWPLPLISIGAAITMITSTSWLTVWTLRVVYELDDARRRSAELAITEERLRIARDLHDVLGKTMTTVAVKSGLAAELVRRGRHDEAGAEMAAVRQIADDAAKETRTVVRGERVVDLARELDGAKALLDSAGVQCTVHDEVSDQRTLDPQLAGVFGWVVREGVTNIIRHSSATRCMINLTADPLRLMINNNGVHKAPDPAGTGLAGMADRLTAAGGTLEHERDGNSFTLTATIEEDR